MRSVTRIGSGLLLAVAALACVLAASPARAQVPICHWPADVPAQLLTSIDTCVKCLVLTPPVCPLAQRQACFEFPESPTEELCDKIAAAEVKGCSKAVQNAAKCNDVRDGAHAAAKNADCQTLADPADQKACSQSVAAELSSLAAAVKEAAAAGQQGCTDLFSSVRALCLGDTF